MDKSAIIKDKRIFNFISFIVFFSIIWEPLRVFHVHVDANGRFVMMLLVSGCLMSMKQFIKLSFKSILGIYALLSIYIIINALIKDTPAVWGTPFVIIRNVISPVLLMYLIIGMAQYSLDKTLRVVIVAMYIFSLLCGLNDVAQEERLGTDINANTIALNAMFCIWGIVFYHIRSRISLIWTILLSIYPAYLIFQTGSRTALAVGMLVIIANAIVNTKPRSSSYIKLIIGGIIVYAAYSYVIENTYIGERLAGTTTQTEGTTRETGTLLDVFGDRGYQYYVSWPYFLDNFWTGIGLRKWIAHSPTGHVFHSEYLVQYCENGIIAFVIYMLFFYKMIIGLIKSKKFYVSYKNNINFILVAIAGIMVINLFYWSFNQYQFFVFYGLALAFCIGKQNIVKRHN